MTSTKATETPIPAAERLIFALDVPGAADARELVATLGDSVSFYKLGLELFMSDGYFPLLHDLLGAGKKVFVDLKFFDVPRTVGEDIPPLPETVAMFKAALSEAWAAGGICTPR